MHFINASAPYQVFTLDMEFLDEYHDHKVMRSFANPYSTAEDIYILLE